MNAKDPTLPASPEAVSATDSLLAAVRAIAQGPLAQRAQSIDQEGKYPLDLLQQLAATGAMSAHLDSAGTPGDYKATIAAMAEVGKVCGATAFMMWCQSVCALYLASSNNPALTGAVLERHRQGLGMGGTGLSNPMKSFAQIESLLLKAVPLPNGGYSVSGTLPWVSHLAGNHYFGAIASVMDGDQSSGREVMFMLRCDAPGVTLKACPKFSAMEGTGTYSVQCRDLVVLPADIVADPARPHIRQIRAAFVMLQCGIAAGIVQGAIDSIWAVEAQLGHVNQFLDDRPDVLQGELDDLVAHVMTLAETPYDTSDEFFMNVLTTRMQGAELCLRASQSALMHQGARGYLMNSDVQRRVREAQFVAIVTPAIKHLRKEVAHLAAEAQPM